MNNIREYYNKQIDELRKSTLVFTDEGDLDIRVLSDDSRDIDLPTLQFLIYMLQMRESRMLEDQEEKRKTPIDEVTCKRLGIRDYTLIEDKAFNSHREIVEAYFDDVGIFTLSDIVVDLKRDLVVQGQGYSIHITYEDAKKLLKPLQNFVQREEKLRERN
ncbi:hypothetical protein NDS46_31710 (plasmid) [Paenibacillus thiaminolyticus]|uniref:hypothetical protein n=1 Tax=Paenibacillus thiaminolyticus TaxID=49283 RepID=UPI00232DB21E|nr:hypothetical protein [Paenibacillus thiaminolyticus]WCF11526.1 hypothetical protein NDS46_31710 [Paenibacillus thiaminolyticus]